jgi:hypothetical protein
MKKKKTTETPREKVTMGKSLTIRAGGRAVKQRWKLGTRRVPWPLQRDTAIPMAETTLWAHGESQRPLITSSLSLSF